MQRPATRRAAPVRPRRRQDDGDAFFPDPENGPARVPDDLAEELAEGFLSSATSGEETDDHERVVPEENGGPFIQTSGDAEFAEGTDDANPEDAEAEPFPNAGSGSTLPPNRRL